MASIKLRFNRYFKLPANTKKIPAAIFRARFQCQNETKMPRVPNAANTTLKIGNIQDLRRTPTITI